MLERIGHLSPGIHRLLLIAGCVLLYFVWFSRLPLTEIDEVRYTEATRQMVTSGNYLIPQFNGAPRYQKPILYYWIQSAAVHALGSDEISVRRPSAVIATAFVLILHAFLYYWLPLCCSRRDKLMQARGRGAAFIGAAALATMPLIAIWARAATTDITLTFFISMALLAMLQADLTRTVTGEEGSRKESKWYLLSALAIALAFLTKGPMGLAIPGLAWLIYHGMQRNLLAEARRVPWLKALLVFLVVAAPWYVATYFVDGPGFLKHFFLSENLGRFTTVMEGHGSSNRLFGLVLYLPMALIFLFPYSPFLIRDLVSPFANCSILRDSTLLSRMRRFAWVWLVAVIGLFSLSKTQLPSYIQSIAAAAAIIFALHVYGRMADRRKRTTADNNARWVEMGLLVLLGSVFVVGSIYAVTKGVASGPFGGEPFPVLQSMYLKKLLMAFGYPFLFGILYWGLNKKTGQMISWTMAGWTLFFVILMLGLAPLAVNSSYRYPIAVGNALRNLQTDEPVYMFCKHPSEAVIYYSHKTIPLYSYGEAAQFFPLMRQVLADGKSALVVVDVEGIKQMRKAAINPTLLGQQYGNIFIVRVGSAPEPAQTTVSDDQSDIDATQ